MPLIYSLNLPIKKNRQQSRAFFHLHECHISHFSSSGSFKKAHEVEEWIRYEENQRKQANPGQLLTLNVANLIKYLYCLLWLSNVGCQFVIIKKKQKKIKRRNRD